LIKAPTLQLLRGAHALAAQVGHIVFDVDQAADTVPGYIG